MRLEGKVPPQEADEVEDDTSSVSLTADSFPSRGSLSQGARHMPSPRGEGVAQRRMRWRYLNKTNNPQLTANAQKLRREMTKEERRLWYDFLKHLPVTVNRQKVIGCYIVDFYCASHKLAIELDGSQHYEAKGSLPIGREIMC